MTVPVPIPVPIPIATPDHWNNFLWALASADIAPEYPLPWLPATRRQALAQYFSEPPIRARLAPTLIKQLEQSKSRRLGIYFENLWAFAFQNHPDYELLARNLPIRSTERTLGELDFVVHYRPEGMEGAVEHWELALKFYLQVGDYWVGPGLKDRLDIKLDHMRNHQLPVAQGPTATSVLHSTGIQLDRQWALMPGRLFRPLIKPYIPPHISPEKNPTSHLSLATQTPPGQLWWAGLPLFLEHFAPSDWRWQQLPKPCWLAPLPTTCLKSLDQALPISVIASRSEEVHALLQHHGPICVASCVASRDGSGELSRGFIVPEDWYTRASESLA